MYQVNNCIRSLALIFLLGGGLLLAAPSAQAQVDIKPGVRVGFNSASFGGDTDEFGQALASELGGLGGISGLDVSIDTGRRSGFTVGGFALIDFGSPLVLQPEVRYIQRGYSIDITVSAAGQSATADGTLNLAYLDIPILARYQFPTGGNFAPFVIAGPTLGFNVTAEREFDVPNEGTDTQDISDSVSGTDFGLEVGAGVDFALSAGTVTLDARYGLGLTDVPDEGDLSLTNRALLVTAGFSF